MQRRARQVVGVQKPVLTQRDEFFTAHAMGLQDSQDGKKNPHNAETAETTQQQPAASKRARTGFPAAVWSQRYPGRLS
jgi:hypothetical protein